MNTRSQLFLKNVLGSVVVKGWSGVVQLLLVPLYLVCLGQYANGLWMTISSILLWIDTFDMGLGNGLRNKLATYVARNDWERAGQAVSTTFFMLVAIVVPLIAVLLAVLSGLDV
jgi:O-antigen/teichoic acid export membrane protein